MDYADDVLHELGKRAVAAPGWKWVECMAAMLGRRIVGVEGDKLWLYPSANDAIMETIPVDNAIPDLSDRATLLLTVDLVAKAHGALHAVLVPAPPVTCLPDQWFVVVYHEAKRATDHHLKSTVVGQADTQAESAVVALEGKRT